MPIIKFLDGLGKSWLIKIPTDNFMSNLTHSRWYVPHPETVKVLENITSTKLILLRRFIFLPPTQNDPLFAKVEMHITLIPLSILT